jgi:CDP-6-deoxy-D-xylo-4-hexulose-3-dehydrase
MREINLVKDTIDSKDVDQLVEWLKTYPRLTKGNLTIEFEEMWSKWLGKKYSVYVNSGSSANLAAIYSLILSGRLKNKKIIVPAVSWVTTVSPAIQLGLEPIMCDCDPDNLGLNIDHLEKLIEEHDPSSLILVHVLGLPNKMKEISDICNDRGILVIEDTCESIGSKYENNLLGTMSDLSTFSFYFGHHMSTIEGGMVSTDDEDLYHILLSIRSHGWDRDLPIEKQRQLRKKYNVTNFRALYNFYYPGFNLRSTDLQAFLGVNQMEKLENIIKTREENYRRYKENLSELDWIPNEPKNSFVSNFAFPIITDHLDSIVNKLSENNIECRPLICGSINEHPFWYERYGEQYLPNAHRVHKNGMYVPNHQNMNFDDVDKVSEIILKYK